MISKTGGGSEDPRETENSTVNRDPSRPENGEPHPNVGQSWGNQTAQEPGEDDVERVLAGALAQAAEAGRFDVVAQLAKELEARRLARAGNVVRLQDEREKRGT
jgi:hypothetical protein